MNNDLHIFSCKATSATLEDLRCISNCVFMSNSSSVNPDTHKYTYLTENLKCGTVDTSHMVTVSLTKWKLL